MCVCVRLSSDRVRRADIVDRQQCAMTGNDMQSILNVDVSVMTLKKSAKAFDALNATFLLALI